MEVHIAPRFFDSNLPLLALLEWTAIQKILCKGNSQHMAASFPNMERRYSAWVSAFDRQAKPIHRNIYAEIITGNIVSMPEFYKRIDGVMPAKLRNIPAAPHQNEQPDKLARDDGSDIIQNHALLADVKQIAFELAEQNRAPETATDRVVQLMVKHNFLTPTDTQIKRLFDYLEKQMAHYLALNMVEAAIIDSDDKNLIFMWNKIKRRFPKDEIFVWPSSVAAKQGKCSKSEVRPIMQKLETLGAITRLKGVTPGSYSKRAIHYRREI